MPAIPVTPLSAGYQINVIAIFAGLYFGMSLLLLSRTDHEAEMGAWQVWVAFAAVQISIWLSFHWRSVRDGLMQLMGDDGLDSFQRERRSTRTVQLSNDRVPVWDTIRVFASALSIIAVAGWFTTRSGGPFGSPFGQFLLAIPLLAPNVSRKRGMIAAVSLATVAAMTFAQLSLCPTSGWIGKGALESSCMPAHLGVSWFFLTSVGVIAFSAFVAEGARRILWRVEARRVYRWWYLTMLNGKPVLRTTTRPSTAVRRVVIHGGGDDSWEVFEGPSLDGWVDQFALYTELEMDAYVLVETTGSEDRGTSPAGSAVRVPNGQLIEGMVRLDGMVFDPKERTGGGINHERAYSPNRYAVNCEEYDRWVEAIWYA